MSRAFLVGLLIACGPPARQDLPSDGGMMQDDARPDAPWYPGQLRPGFHLPGLAGNWDSDPGSAPPRLETSPGGVIVAGGYVQAGDVKAPALWTGTSWSALPATDPYRIAVANDGTIYAVGRAVACDLCGGVTIKSLVQGQWQPLPGGEHFTVTEMAATSLGLIAAVDGVIQRFDGTSWSTLGTPSGGGTPTVEAIVERNGVVCVGGRFTMIDAVPANNVTCLAATGWAQAGGGLVGAVNTLAFTSDGRLVAGGTFAVTGGTNLAVLEPSGWTAVGGGVAGTDAEVKAIAVDGDAIIVGGRFDTPVTNLGRFAQGTWTSPSGAWLSAKLRPVVTDVAVTSDGVYFVGFFDRIGDTVAANIARWTTSVEPLIPAGDAPSGIDGFVDALLPDADGSVIVGGQFAAVGTVAALNVARFTNSGGWQPLGSIDEPVTALGRTDALYAGTANGTVLRWTGSSWASIATLNGRVRAMFAFNGELIVGGDFTTPDRILRWTGSQFERIGIAPPFRVLSLGIVQGRLCAGVFVPDNLPDPQDRPLWCWDGAYWSPQALAGWDVQSIASLDDNTVIVAGSFKADHEYVGLAINRGGAAWYPTRVLHNARLLLPFNGGIFLGGWPYLRWWDGKTDEPHHELAFGGIRALALLPQGLLIGGGDPLSRGNAPPYSFGITAYDF